MPDALRGLPSELVESLRRDCRGDWRRLRFNGDGSITVLNQPPVEAEKPAPAPEPEPVKPPAPRARRDPREMTPPQRDHTPRGNGLRARALKAAVAPVVERAPAPPPETAARLRDLLPPAPKRTPRREELLVDQDPGWQKARPTEEFEPGDYNGDATRLRAQITVGGFQGAIKYHPDVLALEAMPFEDVEAVIRNPTRVEIRPETSSKKYPVLLLARGDIEVVMGFQFRNSPAIIAVYWTHLLGHDDGRFKKGATGAGGGQRKAEGLPSTPGKVLSRLKAMGVEIPNEETTIENTVEVFFRGQNLGKITVGNIYKKGTPEADYQRILRKVDAIRRREVSV